MLVLVIALAMGHAQYAQNARALKFSFPFISAHKQGTVYVRIKPK